MRLLLIEDDRGLGDAIRAHLVGDGHAVDLVGQLEDARAAVAAVHFDLIVLDLGLPDGSGLDFLHGLRREGSSTSVIVATAMDQISQRIAGLNAGADDYLVKPFDLSELSARVNAVARRAMHNPNPALSFGPLTVDIARRSVLMNGQGVEVTGREWAILACMAQHSGAIVSKAELEDALYAFGAEIESNAVEVYVSRLRRKLGQEIITTVRGMGYRLDPG